MPVWETSRRGACGSEAPRAVCLPVRRCSSREERPAARTGSAPCRGSTRSSRRLHHQAVLDDGIDRESRGEVSVVARGRSCSTGRRFRSRGNARFGRSVRRAADVFGDHGHLADFAIVLSMSKWRNAVVREVARRSRSHVQRGSSDESDEEPARAGQALSRDLSTMRHFAESTRWPRGGATHPLLDHAAAFARRAKTRAHRSSLKNRRVPPNTPLR